MKTKARKRPIKRRKNSEESFAIQLENLITTGNPVIIKDSNRKIDLHFSGMLQSWNGGMGFKKQYYVVAERTNGSCYIGFDPKDVKNMYGANIFLDM